MANYFVAFPVRLPEALCNQMPSGLRSFVLDDLHCTLAFLGQLKPELIPDIKAALTEIQCKPIRAQLEQLVMLPSQKKFRALAWTFAQGREATEQLIAQYRDMFLGLAQCTLETRDPLAHVTIARPKSGLRAEQLEEIVEWMSKQKAPSQEFVLDRLALYTWSEQRPAQQFRVVCEHLFEAQRD